MSMGSGRSGDTQPLSQSYYEELGAAYKLPAGSNASALQGANAIPFTNSQGQTGHLDLVGLFDQPSGVVDAELTEHNEDDIIAVTQVDVNAEIYPDAKRFQEPITPVTNGRKRNHSGQVINGRLETPSLPVNPFANHKRADVGVMGLSQVFKTTQAPSSPFLNQLPSDMTSDRPSPDVCIVQRSSTGLPLSSPAKLQHQGLPRRVTEPHDNYISMKASQTEREQRLRMQTTSSPVNKRKWSQDSFDDGFESEESQLRRRLNHKRIELEINHQFINVRAERRPGSRNYGRGLKKGTKGQQGPLSSPELARAVCNTVVISDDPQLEELDGNDSEDETEHEEDVDIQGIDLPDELGEDDKENIEARQVQVPMTTLRTPRKSHITISSQSSPLKQRLRSSRVRDEVDELAADTGPYDALHIGDPVAPALSGQHIAIADSQLSPHTNNLKQNGPICIGCLTRPISSSELEAFVPQSQINTLPYTSQIDSSMVRSLVNGTSVPQGPPLMSSQTNSSPKVRHQSSSSQRISPRKAGPGSESPKLQDTRRSSSQLASSPPCLPSSGSASRPLGSFESRVSPHPKALTDNGRNEVRRADKPDILPATSDATSLPTAHSKIQSAAETHQTPYLRLNTLRSTIPETSSVSRHNTTAIPPFASLKASEPETIVRASGPTALPDSDQRQQPSNASTLFATAKTQQTSTGSLGEPARRLSEPGISPQKATNPKSKSFATIATDLSPPDENGVEDFDISLMTPDDIEFQALMDASSPIDPRRKRRRLLNDHNIRATKETAFKNTPVQSFSALQSPKILIGSPLSMGEKTTVSTAPTEVREPSLVAEAAALDTSIDENPSGMSDGLTKNRKTTRKPTAILPPSKLYRRNLQERIDNENALLLGQQTGHIEVQVEVTRGLSERSVTEPIVASNRVFASFNGSPPGHYPATCIGVTGNENHKYKIRFDDGTVDVVHGAGVKRLELREGDTIKLDSRGARKKTYVVIALLDKRESINRPELDSPTRTRKTRPQNVPSSAFTDIYGYQNVLVRLKQQQHGSQGLTVPISSVYLDSILWKALKDRFYSISAPLHVASSGLSTPSDRPSTPSTPSSRTRRLKASARSYSRNSMPNSAVRKTSDLFDNVIFSITNVSDEVTQQIKAYIKSNGGYLIDDGFDELFDVPSMSPTSPRKRYTDTSAHFCLKPAHQNRGFACLIAEKHGRSRKFFQALALGIPCLAIRWVRDCVSKQKLLPWEPYLLPSGESTFLNTIRTRLLPAYPTESARLPEIIAHRPNFLAGSSVLLITGKGKEEQMMKAYPFIAYALGAAKVSRAVSLDAAQHMVQEAQGKSEPWDWVCHPEGSKKHAESVLFGNTGQGRKRKRSGTLKPMGNTRVVATEFVMQSLILGQLLDDE